MTLIRLGHYRARNIHVLDICLGLLCQNKLKVKRDRLELPMDQSKMEEFFTKRADNGLPVAHVVPVMKVMKSAAEK